MKLKIKVKKNKNISLPKIIGKGDWIDLMSAEKVVLRDPFVDLDNNKVIFDSRLINLGVAMQLPKGFEAVILPRSSTYKNFGVVPANSEGVIDNTYCGNNDEWKFSALALRSTVIQCGDRICQFRIQLSQKATVWQKLRWLLSSGIEIVEVDKLSNTDRNGIGSTGIN